MKTFHDYLNLKEIAQYNVTTNVSNHNSDSSQVFDAAMQAFQLVLNKNTEDALAFLHRMSEDLPEIKPILQNVGANVKSKVNFNKEFKRMKEKGRQVDIRGLGNVSPEDMNKDVDILSTNSSDSFHNPIG